MDKAAIARNLIHQRKLKGLTQEQLAESSGVAKRTIQRIENAKVEPHLQTLSLLAQSLELEVNELSLIAPAEQTDQSSAVDRKWLVMFHLLPILGIIIPFSNLVIPVILWAYKRDDNSLYDEHGRAVINFHLTVTLAFGISIVLLVRYFYIGLPLIILIGLYAIVLVLWNTRSVMKNKRYRYPLSVKFL